MFAPLNTTLNLFHVLPRPRVLTLLAAWLCVAAAPASAAIWTGADHNWFNAANWTPTTVPTNSGSGVGASLTSTSLNFNAVGATARFLTVGGTGQLNVLGGDLTYFGDGLIGTTAQSNGPGVVNQSAGAVTQTVGTGLLIGHRLSGTWNLSGGSLEAQTPVHLGYEAGGTGLLSISGTGDFSAHSVVIGRVSGTSGELRYTGGATSSVTIQNDLQVGLSGAGELTLGGSGGQFNLGKNLTFNRDDSTLNVQITNPTSFNTLNAGTLGGNVMMIKTDALGVSGADLNVELAFDLTLGDYAWTIIDIVGAGQYGVSGVYFEDNLSAALGPVGFFNGLPNGSTFTVHSTTTNTPYLFTINYDGGNGNDLVLSTSVSAVIPEPSSLAIWGCGLALLGYRLRKRSRRVTT